MEGDWVPVTEGDFSRPLTFPASQSSGFTLTPQLTSGADVNGAALNVYGYESGAILGPTLRFERGQTVSVNVKNQLNEVTNVHWHGLAVPPSMDGQPHQFIQPGSSFLYSYTVNQRAATYWYHPHPHGDTARQVMLGLAGLLVVTDDEEAALNLPHGDRELFLVLQDKRIAGNEITYAPTTAEIMTGFMGDRVFVNGIYAPYHAVNRMHYRVRILNGSNARVYHLALSDGKSFTVIGNDGGLLAAPESVTSALLAPGERLDVLIDFSTSQLNEEIFLVSKPFDGGSSQGHEEFRIMKFTVTGNETDSFQIPSALSVITSLSESQSTKTRTFDISNPHDSMGGHMHSGHTINGVSYDESHIDEHVETGAIEIWTFDNSIGGEPHPMHLHGVQFQILDRTGGRGMLEPYEKGWKDTVLLLPEESVRVIVPFGTYTGSYVFHCHNLEHEDDGMMLQYELS
jgi:FtsP/CotA-like multicopper oxidase with cupredoxin domain